MGHWVLILGLLGVLQAIFLPGFLVIRSFKLSFPWLRALVFACALSLSLNYIVGLSLVSLHCYTTFVMQALVFIELLALAYLLRQDCLKPVNWHQIKRPFAELYQQNPAVSFIVFLVLLVYLYQALSNFGSIFTEWDAVVSWNHWAIEWSYNQFSSGTDHYPQLLPINFSIPYVLIGGLSGPLKLQAFAKIIALLLSLLPLLALLDLSSSTKKPAYLWSLIFIALTYWLIYRDSIGAGYADVPVSILGFIGFYALILATQSEKPLSYIVLGTMVCAGAAVTKQAGCYVALLYPVLVYVLYSHRHYSLQKSIGLILGQYASLSVIILPWYLYNQHLINAGLNGSEIGFVTSQIYGNISIGQRVFEAFREIKFAIWFCLFFSFIHACYNKEWRICFAVIVIPYVFIWAFCFSYDLRNLALIIPWIGFAAGFGLLELFSKPGLQSFVKKLSRVNTLSLLVGLVVVIAVLSCGPMRNEKLQAHELQQEQQLGGDVGLWLYQYQAMNGLSGKIDTDWQYLAYLPGLSQHYYEDKLTSVNVLNTAMANSQIGYFLTIDDELSPSVNNAMAGLIKTKKLEILWHWDDMTFYRINHE
ncbi:MAG: hypothetical protein K0R66_1012 [Gammaproteobacteria bacterium]|jgi:hypothetical protein|nr:hypothetical protein [Gammaproteobacteria bacterium]